MDGLASRHTTHWAGINSCFKRAASFSNASLTATCSLIIISEQLAVNEALLKETARLKQELIPAAQNSWPSPLDAGRTSSAGLPDRYHGTTPGRILMRHEVTRSCLTWYFSSCNCFWYSSAFCLSFGACRVYGSPSKIKLRPSGSPACGMSQETERVVEWSDLRGAKSEVVQTQWHQQTVTQQLRVYLSLRTWVSFHTFYIFHVSNLSLQFTSLLGKHSIPSRALNGWDCQHRLYVTLRVQYLSLSVDGWDMIAELLQMWITTCAVDVWTPKYPKWPQMPPSLRQQHQLPEGNKTIISCMSHDSCVITQPYGTCSIRTAKPNSVGLSPVLWNAPQVSPKLRCKEFFPCRQFWNCISWCTCSGSWRGALQSDPRCLARSPCWPWATKVRKTQIMNQ